MKIQQRLICFFVLFCFGAKMAMARSHWSFESASEIRQTSYSSGSDAALLGYRQTELASQHLGAQLRWSNQGLRGGVETLAEAFQGSEVAYQKQRGGIAPALVPLPPKGNLWFLQKNDSSAQNRQTSLWVNQIYVERDWQQFSLILGRQQVSWGDGLFFQVFDLISPINPLSYGLTPKYGKDLLQIRRQLAFGELDLLWLPQRKGQGRQSSQLFRLQGYSGAWQLKLMGGLHDQQKVLGLGASHTLGRALGRLNLRATHTKRGATYVSGVANLDYSFQVRELDCYLFGEYFYQAEGESVDRYRHLEINPDLFKAIQDKQSFFLGRQYSLFGLRTETEGQWKFNLRDLINLADQSSRLLGSAEWVVAQNWSLLLQGETSFGPANSELTGLQVGAGITQKPGTSAKIQVKADF